MDFQKLLSVANINEAEAKTEASRKRYSTVLEPPKKQPRSNVHSSQIKQFLARREQEEKQKESQAREKREQLLALRAQNTKNNKKAKIMASRTKDNDFSRIKITDDELEAKQKRERELMALELKNKRERMMARIQLEEKEKDLPRKRKRKHKLTEGGEEVPVKAETETDVQEDTRLKNHSSSSRSDKAHSKGQKNHQRRPAPPSLNFSDLLKVAAEKQYQPVELKKVEKKEERPLTKKAKRIQQEAEERVRRKMSGNPTSQKSSKERTNGVLIKSEPDIQNVGKSLNNQSFNRKANKSSVNEDNRTSSDRNSHSSTKKSGPTIMHVQKVESPKSKPKVMPIKRPPDPNPPIGEHSQKQRSGPMGKPVASMSNQQRNNLPMTNGFKQNTSSNDARKTQVKNSQQMERSSKTNGQETKSKPSKKSSESKKTAQAAPSASNPANVMLTEDVIAQIENRIRAKMEKEMEEKFARKKAEEMASQSVAKRTDPPNPVKKPTPGQKPNSGKPQMPVNSQRDLAMPKKSTVPPRKMENMLPPKNTPRPKAFHPNPYLLPPRRLLETQPPQRSRRRVESDDDDEDDDDDMSDFIDNSADPEHDDYSKYIREIFQYDRTRYVDEDDDDIMESSFAQQMHEETQSAKIGFLEDLEEEKKEKEELKRKKMKQKQKK